MAARSVHGDQYLCTGASGGTESESGFSMGKRGMGA